MKASPNPSDASKLQQRYAYYRRCQTILRNGKQCKCPALKEGQVCRNHAEQAERAERRSRQKAAVLERVAEKLAPDFIAGGEEVLFSREGMLALINETMLALADGRLDEKGVGEMIAGMQAAIKAIHRVAPRRKGLAY